MKNKELIIYILILGFLLCVIKIKDTSAQNLPYFDNNNQRYAPFIPAGTPQPSYWGIFTPSNPTSYIYDPGRSQPVTPISPINDPSYGVPTHPQIIQVADSIYTNSNGYVGIGTQNPKAVLDVSGDIAINGITVINENGQWVGSGSSGLDGKSAYDIWLNAGNNGSEVDFLASLKAYPGIPGADGQDGGPGKEGPRGEKGDKPGHQWSGTRLRFENTNGSWGDYTDLKGEKGDPGIPGTDGRNGAPGKEGPRGEKGDKPGHQWSGTRLRFENTNGSWGSYINLKGDKGDPGLQGPPGPEGPPGPASTLGGGDGHSLDSANGSIKDALFVDDIGNVGIGTMNPGVKLHVAGGPLSIETSDVFSLKLGPECCGAGNSDTGIGHPGDGIIIFINDNVERMRITKYGNVGIGTTDPRAALDVGSGGICLGGETRYKWPASSGGEADNLGNHVATQNLQLNGHWLSNDGENEGVYVSSKGNVGIGITEPQALLEVAGSVYFEGGDGDAWIDGELDAFDVLAATHILSPSWSDLTITNEMYANADIDGDGRVTIDDLSMITQLVVGRSRDKVIREIHSIYGGYYPDIFYVSGKAGIGTNCPDAALHVMDKKTSEEDTSSQTSEATSAVLHVETQEDKNAIYVLHNGNVGIGTAEPQGKLDINGSIYQSGSELYADYVFEPQYKLESIEEHATFMWENKHLKGIPKETRDENGREIVEIGVHRKGIVEELEKAHIYIEKLHEQNKNLEERIAKLESALDKR